MNEETLYELWALALDTTEHEFKTKARTILQAATRDRKTAQQRYEEFGAEADATSPLERLRFFCSLAMEGQDWIDVEPYFDAIEQAATRNATNTDAEWFSKVVNAAAQIQATHYGDATRTHIALHDWSIQFSDAIAASAPKELT